VAIRGIWPRNLANDQISAPAILHRQFPCLLRHKFLTRDFLGVRLIRGRLFGPQLYTNGLSWQTISWYYPFKGLNEIPVVGAEASLLPAAAYAGQVATTMVHKAGHILPSATNTILTSLSTDADQNSLPVYEDPSPGLANKC
jgi:hypothetical protein